MRPTRWTRQKRRTKYGKGGWSIRRFGFGYTHPVTGDGIYSGWHPFRLIALRRRREQERALRRLHYPESIGWPAGFNDRP